MHTNHSELRVDLAALTAKTAATLRRARIRDGLADDLQKAAPLAVIVPGLAALSRLSGPLDLGALDVLLLLAGTLLPPLAFLGAGAFWRWTRPIDPRDALAALDSFLGLKERLVAAAEFLERPERGAFMEAAVEDAERYARSALGAELHLESTPWARAGRARAWIAAAGILVLICLWPTEVRGPAAEPDLAALPVMQSADPGARPLDEAEPPSSPALRPPPEAGAPPGLDELQEATPQPSDATSLPEEAKRSEGRTGSGRTSHAKSASGRSEAMGAPTRQAQTSKEAAESKPRESKKKPDDEQRRPPTPPRSKELQEESGATAGRGSSRGSNKNPAATDWKSRDHVETTEEEPLEDDEEVEDESEESESRGGIQPTLRDRKPPVSRDLSIGFGNRPNPDANGRGGPSAQKKSRGTASLVLGVPIPDRVKGQPNPGKTKITQERVQPRPEASGPERAAPRRPREEPAGYLGRPDLEPWMKDLVRAYFLNLRTEPNPDDQNKTTEEPDDGAS